MLRIFLIIIFSVILQSSFLLSICFSVPKEPELYYFNPDSAQTNLGRLKLEMDTFFDRSGYAVSFQAFSYQTDFDHKIKKQQPQFLYVPEWYIKKYGSTLKIKPFLVPVYKGETSYRKVLLVAKTSTITIDSIVNRSLAMTSMGPDSEVILNQILFPDTPYKSGAFNPVIVPKSTDALFALTLGQVDLALVVKEHMETFKKLLPTIIDSVKPLTVSEPIPMSMLCYSEELIKPSDVEKMKNIMLRDDSKKARNKIMELLQIDEWQETKK